MTKFLVMTFAIILGFAFYAKPVALSIRQGLDLQGGTHVVLQAVDTPDAKVDDVISKKSLQGIKITEARSIGGTVYTLKWDATDDKCYWLDASNKNLDSSITPGGATSAVAFTGNETVSSLF